MRDDLVVPGEHEENFVLAKDARVVTVRIMLVADNELHRTNIERECLPAIAEAFNVTNIRVVTQG